MIDNPVRSRFNAWFFAALDGYMHRKYAGIKSALLKNAPAVVVELGPGSGVTLRYLSRGTTLIAIEPNKYMHRRLTQRANHLGIDLDLRGLAGEQIDLAAQSVDFVFSSLVLCSVEQPRQVISEVRRILKSGGRFACVEHVEAPAGTAIRRLQRTIREPWKWVFEGCDLCRDTGEMLKTAGFSEVDVVPIVVSTIFIPIRHQITAMCVK
jgi:ubiquinone/menaquinone biosynthesis C-methylase UbiE